MADITVSKHELITIMILDCKKFDFKFTDYNSLHELNENRKIMGL